MADTPAAAAAPPVKEEGMKRAAPGDEAPKLRLPIKKNVSAFLHFCLMATKSTSTSLLRNSS